MPTYKAPLRDMRFVMNELLEFPKHYETLPGGSDAVEVADAILEEGAKFAENVLTPLNLSGDQEGCSLKDGEVTTPKGFKEAYQQYVEGGWPSMSQDPDYGGQGLPHSLGMVLNEMITSSNLAWGMYPGLSHGAMDALRHHGSEVLKQTYLTKLIEGTWTGTMCLTEPHCGTDLGLIKTKAEPQDNETYRVTGTKIFISAGEHDLAENIVHLVLAKLPDAPAGTKGISLFLVPKFMPNDDGTPGTRNAVQCGALEHKMGIHGNSTCVMNFDGATGFLVGQPNKGLSAMFTMMNAARIGVGIQGQGLTEVAYQNSLAYARDRLQMRALSGPKAPEKAADPIIVHPDVRRMLLTQKAFSEGGRALIYYTAKLVDQVEHGSDEAKADADELLGLLTPIVKAFLTEAGFDSTNEGLQIFGGHGFIAEWGMEQFVRDARITRLYEGTTGIQALDLLGRKVLMNQGESLRKFTKQIHKFCQAAEDEQMSEFTEPLAKVNKEWGELTMKIGMAAMQNRDEVGAASFDYLMYSGYVTLAYFFAQMAQVAQRQLASGTSETAFYQAKIETARFYYQRLLPRTQALATSMLAGADTLLSLSEDDFGLAFEV